MAGASSHQSAQRLLTRYSDILSEVPPKSDPNLPIATSSERVSEVGLVVPSVRTRPGLLLDTERYQTFGAALDLRNATSNLSLILLGGSNASAGLAGVPLREGASHFDSQHISQFIGRYRDKELICVNGTARNEAVRDESVTFLNELACRLVPEGVGLSSGGATSGAMGVSIDAFTRAIVKCRQGEGTEAEIATVLLFLKGEKYAYEVPKDVGGVGERSQKQRSWLTRTPTLHGVGHQDVLLYVEGGLGTLFEIFYPLACRQLYPKSIVGVFHEGRSADRLVFASAPLADGRNFWAPSHDLISEMKKCGLSQHYFDPTMLLEPFTSPEQIAEAADVILGCYERGRKDRELYRAAAVSPCPEAHSFEVAMLSMLHELGFAPREHEDFANSFIGLLDNAFSAQRALYHLRKLNTARASQGEEGVGNYLSELIKTAELDRGGALAMIRRFQDTPSVYMIGSSKDAWNEQLERYSRRLIAGLVEQGYALVLDGNGKEGIPLRWSEIWVECMRDFEATHGRRSGSELVRIQLAYENEETPARRWEGGYHEIVPPAVLNVEMRTALAGCIGSKRGVVLAPGGHPELCAWSHLILDWQLAGSIDGCYAEKDDRAEFQVLNVPGMPGRGPFYAGLQDQLEVMVKEKTISPDEYDPRCFDRLENPEPTADRLLFFLSS